MNRQKLSLQVIEIIFIMLLFVGCGGSPALPTPIPLTVTLTPILPTATHTTVPPTAIPPTQTPLKLITDVEMLFGIWQPISSSRDAMFLQINSDGTCRQSFSLDGLSGTAEVECTYNFENSILSIEAVKLNGVPECPSPIGSYEVSLIADDQIQLVASEDSCAPRRRSTQGMYQHIP